MIDPLMECWMVDDALLSDNDSIVPVVYLVFRLKTLRMSYMGTTLFDTRLISLEVSDLVESRILMMKSISKLFDLIYMLR